ncbi:MAG TPA: hypothetical protein VII37_09740, partial [Candidatus Acidoferrum sp.]
VRATLRVVPEHVVLAEEVPLVQDLRRGTPVLQETRLRLEMRPAQGIPPLRETPIVRGARLIESVTSVYFEAGCDVAADGRHITGGHCELHAAAGFGAA